MLKKRKIQVSKFLFKNESTYESNPIEGKKAHRTDELFNSYVEVGGVKFDANEEAMDRIDRVLDVANFKFNRAIAQGNTATAAYDEFYIQTTLAWKSYDNKFVNVNIETLASVQELALQKMSQIWIKYG